MKRNYLKRLLSSILVVAMVLGMIGTSTLAGNPGIKMRSDNVDVTQFIFKFYIDVKETGVIRTTTLDKTNKQGNHLSIKNPGFDDGQPGT